jgi:molecular chaperone GrpE
MAKQKEKQKDKQHPADLEAVEESPEGAAEETAEQNSEEIKEAPDLETLQEELAEALAKAEENLDGWQRAQAEFANYKKRVDRERIQVFEDAVGRAAKRYLEIADDLERALNNRPQEGDGAEWAEGIELVHRKLLNFLESEGVKPMQVEGEQFDPSLHEAISQDESDDHESGQIIEVIQQGYMLGERVLRPALVRIAR